MAASRRRHSDTSAVPAEERLGVADVVGHQPHVRARRARLGRAVSDQRRVLAQDRLLQRHQVGARVDAQLLGQDRRARCRVRSASPCLPAWYWASASSVHRCSRSGSSATRAWASARTAGTGPPAPRPGAAPRRPSAAVPAGRPRSGPAPSRRGRPAPGPATAQRLVHHVGRPIGLAQRQQLPAARPGPLEPAGVDLFGRHHQAIALRPGLDRRRTQHLAQLHHAALQRLRPRRRQPVAPPGIGQTARRRRPLPAAGQRRQHHPIAGPERPASSTLTGPKTAIPTRPLFARHRSRQRHRYRADTAAERDRQRVVSPQASRRAGVGLLRCLSRAARLMQVLPALLVGESPRHLALGDIDELVEIERPDAHDALHADGGEP